MATGLLLSEQRKSLELATERYVEHLDKALPYLAKRGISSHTALSRGLGYVENPIPEHKIGRGRLSIPYLTPVGTVAMTFRCIQEHRCRDIERHSKYVKPSGQTAVLYGVKDAFKDTLDIHIAEGELDSITLSELCGLPSIGISGAQYWQVWWKEVLKDFRRVFVYCDGDEAGRSLGNKLVKEIGMAVVPIHLPDGEDVNSFYLKEGPHALREMAK